MLLLLLPLQVDDLASSVTGFCLSRSTISSEELGDAALSLAFDQCSLVRNPGEDEQSYRKRRMAKAKKDLERKKDTIYTVLRRSFNNTVVLTVGNLRWLYYKRGFRGFKIRHLLYYNTRDYLKPYVTGLLQRRHDLNMAGERDSLEASLLKLLLNGLYGG